MRRIGRRIGVLDSPSDVSNAARPLRLLLIGAILLPVTLFMAVAAIAYVRQFDDARDRLRRNLAIINEHANKVFETFEFSSRYLDEIAGNLTDDEIRSRETAISERLAAMTKALPQLRDLWLIGADGRALVSGTIYPMPPLNVSDRDYFKVHRDQKHVGPYVTELLAGRADEQIKFFAISRPRVVNGRFAGVTVVSIAPEYFSQFYAQLPPGGSATLIRNDGPVLVRYPTVAGLVDRLPPRAPFFGAVEANPRTGMVTAPTGTDGRVRIFTYQQLDKLPQLYVIAGADRAEIISRWLWQMGGHLVFGVPATVALIALGLVALRRTERLHAEVSRREASEQALRQSQKMEAIGRLSGGIAHDFNNMLTVILGNIDMAARRLDNSNPKVERLLTAASQASQRAATLVQRMLAFSRQHPQEVKAVDVNRLVQGTSELMRRTLGETVMVETVLGAGVRKIAVDVNQLENAILNLAVNARDAMPTGGRLTIETSNSYLDESYTAANTAGLSPGHFVQIAITDSGTGMSQEVRERAFEPFFTTKPTGMGTGLGLSMVYGFMRQSEGHVKIYSEPGEGTCIKLYFPRLADDSSLTEWGEDRALPREVVPKGRETILLVEDDEDVRRFGVEVLSEQGYTIIPAPDGPTALRLLDAEPGISLLFTDVILPGGMNGRQIADEALKRRPTLKVLFATGYTRNAIIHHGRLDPEVELLSKPFTADALARKVRAILDGPAGVPPPANQA